MIEILPDIFYDPSKEWYEQPEELIALAGEVEQAEPIAFENEEGGGHTRLLWGEWEHTTECGTFLMRVNMGYLYEVENPAFRSRLEHDQVIVTKLS